MFFFVFVFYSSTIISTIALHIHSSRFVQGSKQASKQAVYFVGFLIICPLQYVNIILEARILFYRIRLAHFHIHSSDRIRKCSIK